MYARHLRYDLRVQITEELHGTRIGDHSGVYRTWARIRLRFFWMGMTRDIKDFISRCQVCQQIKKPATKPIGLLQPLEILTAIWKNISMNFFTGLPSVGCKFVIVIVVDRLSKYCHLGALSAGYTASSVTEFFCVTDRTTSWHAQDHYLRSGQNFYE